MSDGRDTGGFDVDDLAALLRGSAEPAPASVTERAVARVRVESTALILLRTLGGSWLRVARAVPDLLAAPQAHATEPPATGPDGGPPSPGPAPGTPPGAP